MSSFHDPLVITTERLTLTPLRLDDADEMVTVLADEQLHEFIGGRPARLDELRRQYVRLVAGSANPNEVWLNWVVRRTSDLQPVGAVQATIVSDEQLITAVVAWVIGVGWQNQGFASEAARELVAWLRDHGADTVVAHIHPDHRASAIVATRAAFQSTADLVDGEQVWRTTGR